VVGVLAEPQTFDFRQWSALMAPKLHSDLGSSALLAIRLLAGRSGHAAGERGTFTGCEDQHVRLTVMVVLGRDFNVLKVTARIITQLWSGVRLGSIRFGGAFVDGVCCQRPSAFG
jgi:hypothetical protein